MCNTCNHRHTNCCHTSPHHCCRCRPVLIVADRPEREESECKKKERTCRHCSCRPPVMIAPSSSQRPGRSSCHSESERSESERSGCSSCHSESERPEWPSCHPWPVWPCTHGTAAADSNLTRIENSLAAAAEELECKREDFSCTTVTNQTA